MPRFLFFFIVEHTMAVAFEFGVSDLLLEFFAHTLYVLALAHFTGAISALGFQAFLYCADYIFVFVITYLHIK